VPDEFTDSIVSVDHTVVEIGGVAGFLEDDCSVTAILSALVSHSVNVLFAGSIEDNTVIVEISSHG